VGPITPPEQNPRDEYREALREYVAGGGEDSLLIGYSIGRETIAEGLTSLVALHGEALKSALGGDPSPERLAEMIDRSTQFLEESLAPFEMTVRGFQESNDRLVRANQELKRAEEMEKRFLANMSHELRTPLNAILGFAELLIDNRESDIAPDRRRKFLETIHRSGKHLLALINDILDLAKVDAGQMTIEVESIPAGLAVLEALGVVEPLAQDRGIVLASDIDEAVSIAADPGRFKQILLNLLSNAIKFTDQGGHVSVTASQEGQSVRFEVTDTGIGITQEDQARLFHEFQQASPADRRQQGTGLGLALTRRLVELHGGAVGLDSVPNKGSTFWFTMPLAAQKATSANASPDQPVRGVGPLILVVEDDESAAELLIHYLHSAGYQTEVARDGIEALEKARRLTPAAITLDVMLPELDGWEVLAELKQDQRTRDIPVVVVSVTNQQSNGRALGAADYFVKPVNRDALIARLSRYAFTGTVKQREVKVLVVDDDPEARELVAKILEPLGFTVIRAANGEEGVELARQTAPDLVILDLVMPGISGFEVVRILKADLYTRAIPVLVVTAKDITPKDKKALSGDVEMVLSKGSLASIDLSAWLEEALGPNPGASIGRG
jgi:signal transduction histidine kinase/DNA-binding response OmpR family regulator